MLCDMLLMMLTTLLVCMYEANRLFTAKNYQVHTTSTFYISVFNIGEGIMKGHIRDIRHG